MTQKTTTLAEKLESIKAALEFYSDESLYDNGREPRCKDYKLLTDSGKHAITALATLQELETEMASAEMAEKVYISIGNSKAYCDKAPLKDVITHDEIKTATEAAIKTILGK